MTQICYKATLAHQLHSIALMHIAQFSFALLQVCCRVIFVCFTHIIIHQGKTCSLLVTLHNFNWHPILDSVQGPSVKVSPSFYGHCGLTYVVLAGSIPRLTWGCRAWVCSDNFYHICVNQVILYYLMGNAVAHINVKLLYFGLPISLIPRLSGFAWVQKFKWDMYQLKFDHVLFLQEYQIERNSWTSLWVQQSLKCSLNFSRPNFTTRVTFIDLDICGT